MVAVATAVPTSQRQQEWPVVLGAASGSTPGVSTGKARDWHPEVSLGSRSVA